MYFAHSCRNIGVILLKINYKLKNRHIGKEIGDLHYGINVVSRRSLWLWCKVGARETASHLV